MTQNIVYISRKVRIFVSGEKHVSKGSVHQPLKSGRGIAKAKRKLAKLIQTHMCDHGNLFAVFFSNRGMPKPTKQI